MLIPIQKCVMWIHQNLVVEMITVRFSHRFVALEMVVVSVVVPQLAIAYAQISALLHVRIIVVHVHSAVLATVMRLQMHVLI